jgi:2'-5' RNA ligase
MRLFTGIDLPASVVEELARLLARLRPLARANWSRVENLHITTKFIGEWPQDRLDELKAALRTVPARPPVRVSVGGLGWFPNEQAPRVFWAGVRAGPELERLAADTDRAASTTGVPREQRRFSPHLTLARIKEPSGLARLREAAGGLAEAPFGEFAADRFYLYLSERGPAGSTYTKLEEFLLEKG